MAHRLGNTYCLDEGETAKSNCIWCGKDCERTELLDTGEAIERWCYCKECNSECWHPIEQIQQNINMENELLHKDFLTDDKVKRGNEIASVLFADFDNEFSKNASVPKLEERYPYDAMIEHSDKPGMHRVVAQNSTVGYTLYEGTYSQCTEWKRINCVCV